MKSLALSLHDNARLCYGNNYPVSFRACQTVKGFVQMCRGTMIEEEAPTVARTGTTLTYSCATSNARVSVDYDLRCNQLRLSMDVGEYAFTSDWQQVRPFSEQPDTGQLILEALVQWRALATTPSTLLRGNLRMMSAMGLAWETLEHLLTEL
jgi:hypothetical protein